MIPTALIAAALAQAAVQPAPTPTPEPFTVGVTTYQSITDQLGKPQSVSILGDGTKIIVYMSSRTKIKGASFVPIVGLFAGGAKSRMIIRTFTFGPDSVLRNYSTTDSAADCSVGLLGAKCK
jgi:hypothetical protein